MHCLYSRSQSGHGGVKMKGQERNYRWPKTVCHSLRHFLTRVSGSAQLFLCESFVKFTWDILVYLFIAFDLKTPRCSPFYGLGVLYLSLANPHPPYTFWIFHWWELPWPAHMLFESAANRARLWAGGAKTRLAAYIPHESRNQLKAYDEIMYHFLQWQILTGQLKSRQHCHLTINLFDK